jgi:hypothetical protein
MAPAEAGVLPAVDDAPAGRVTGYGPSAAAYYPLRVYNRRRPVATMVRLFDEDRSGRIPLRVLGECAFERVWGAIVPSVWALWRAGRH